MLTMNDHQTFWLFSRGVRRQRLRPPKKRSVEEHHGVRRAKMKLLECPEKILDHLRALRSRDRRISQLRKTENVERNIVVAGTIVS